jgi:hypothetical protein
MFPIPTLRLDGVSRLDDYQVLQCSIQPTEWGCGMAGNPPTPVHALGTVQKQGGQNFQL